MKQRKIFWTVEVIDAGDSVSLKTPRGRQRKTISLVSKVTDDGKHEDKRGAIESLDLPEVRELKEEEDKRDTYVQCK